MSGSIEALLAYFYIYFLIKFSFIEKEVPTVKIYFPVLYRTINTTFPEKWKETWDIIDFIITLILKK